MKQTKVPRNLSTPENRAFWASIDKAAARWRARNEGREMTEKPEIELSEDYIIQYDSRASCPNHPDTDRQDIWLMCPKDPERWEFMKNKEKASMPAFYICFVCRRIGQVSGKGGEVKNVTDIEDYERGAESR